MPSERSSRFRFTVGVSEKVGAYFLLKKMQERNEIPLFSEIQSVEKPFFTFDEKNIQPRAEELQYF